MEKPQIIVHSQESVNYTLFDAKWIPFSAKFVTLGSHPRGTGALQIYELSDGKVQRVSERELPKGFKCGTFGASNSHDRHLATGDFEGKLNTWDLEKPDVPVYSAKAHSQIINAIDGVGGVGVGKGAPELVTGSRDGSVKVWDLRQHTSPVATMEPVQGEDVRDCWTVAFGNSYNNEERCVCAGYDNGDVKLFDLRNMSVKWEKNLKNGVCCVEFDRKDIEMNKLVVTTLESKFHLFDVRTLHPKKGFASLTKKAHKSTIWVARHLPQNRDIFATAGGSGSLNLWTYKYPSNRKKCDGGSPMGVIGDVELLQSDTFSNQPISSLDWNVHKLGLGVCTSFDQVVRVIIVTKLNRI